MSTPRAGIAPFTRPSDDDSSETTNDYNADKPSSPSAGLLPRVLENIAELHISVAAASLVAAAFAVMRLATAGKKSLNGAQPLSALEATPHAALGHHELVVCCKGLVAELEAPGSAQSSNGCLAFVLMHKGKVIASSNACTDFVIVHNEKVVASSNHIRDFVVVDRRGIVVGAANTCREFVLNCAFDADETAAGSVSSSSFETLGTISSAPTDLELVFVHATSAPASVQTELSYDPLKRFITLAPQLKTPRGFKSVEHERALRESCPTLGSLAPRADHPARHELSYDPLTRFVALAPQLKIPRGFNSVEHERALRQSRPRKPLPPLHVLGSRSLSKVRRFARVCARLGHGTHKGCSPRIFSPQFVWPTRLHAVFCPYRRTRSAMSASCNRQSRSRSRFARSRSGSASTGTRARAPRRASRRVSRPHCRPRPPSRPASRRALPASRQAFGMRPTRYCLTPSSCPQRSRAPSAKSSSTARSRSRAARATLRWPCARHASFTRRVAHVRSVEQFRQRMHTRQQMLHCRHAPAQLSI
jgi:hypothetical protein